MYPLKTADTPRGLHVLLLQYLNIVWHNLYVIVSCSWDESSSISSGLSDGSDNLSSEEFNTSPTLNSLPTTPIGSRRNSAIVVSNAQISTHTLVLVRVVLIKLLIQWGIDEVLNDVSFTQQAAGHWHQRQSLIKYSVRTHNIYHICRRAQTACWIAALFHVAAFWSFVGFLELCEELIRLILEVSERNVWKWSTSVTAGIVVTHWYTLIYQNQAQIVLFQKSNVFQDENYTSSGSDGVSRLFF